MKFCIRVDDFGYLPMTPKQNDAGLRLARRFHGSMQGRPYLAGVIPFCLDTEGKEWLSSKPGGLTVALHGFNHRTVDGVASEFRGLSFDQCRSRLAAGRSVCVECGHFPEHFIPPFNAVEPDLPEAGFHEGIRYIWGAPSNWPTPAQPYPMGRITFVPSWAPTYAATLWQIGVNDRPLSGILPSLLNDPGKAIIALHITWEAAGCDDFRGVQWLIEVLGNRIITPEEYLK